MHEIINKYFWDGTQNVSDEFVIRRMLEYASFPDLLKLPFDKLRHYLLNADTDRLRTGEKRKEFIKAILPYIKNTDSLESAVFQMIQDYFG